METVLDVVRLVAYVLFILWSLLFLYAIVKAIMVLKGFEEGQQKIREWAGALRAPALEGGALRAAQGAASNLLPKLLALLLLLLPAIIQRKLEGRIVRKQQDA